MTTLRQLRFLVALSDTENVSRPADVCHGRQLTLSSGLKELEGRLGVKVAERTTHSALTTPEGSDLAYRAGDILARVDDFEDFARPFPRRARRGCDWAPFRPLVRIFFPGRCRSSGPG